MIALTYREIIDNLVQNFASLSQFSAMSIVMILKSIFCLRKTTIMTKPAFVKAGDYSRPIKNTLILKSKMAADGLTIFSIDETAFFDHNSARIAVSMKKRPPLKYKGGEVQGLDLIVAVTDDGVVAARASVANKPNMYSKNVY